VTTQRFINADEAKCASNPLHEECKDCLRNVLPVNPASLRQVWVGPWVIDDEPCPSRWVRSEDSTDWSAA
jgi:hypothetical protein